MRPRRKASKSSPTRALHRARSVSHADVSLRDAFLTQEVDQRYLVFIILRIAIGRENRVPVPRIVTP